MQPKKSSLLLLVVVTTLCIGTKGALGQFALVANPSFESNYNESPPHFSGIDLWIGGSGVNDRSHNPVGPFHDNGRTPDRNRVAFIQNAGELYQMIFNLVPGQIYWVQFFYNCRAWPSGGPVDIKVSFAGTPLAEISHVRAVGDPNAFRFKNIAFTAPSSFGSLRFEVVPYDGEQAALIDGVTMVAREADDLVVINPSFEASGTAPGTGPLTNMAGWTGTGTYGVDVAGGAYADNGIIPDQDLVAFIQGEGTLAQTVSGLITGQQYVVSFAYNAKAGQLPHLLAKAGNTVLLDTDVMEVGAGNPFHTATASFTATAGEVLLTFTQTKTGSDTVLLDNVRVRGHAKATLPPVRVDPWYSLIRVGHTQMVQVTVPAEVLVQRPAHLRVACDPTVAAIRGADTNGGYDLVFTGPGTETNTPVSGMKLWLKADAITGLSNGDKVVQWPDSSGGNYHATNAIEYNQPTYVASGRSGKPTVRFDDRDQDTISGTAQWLEAPAPVQSKRQPFTAFVVFRSDDTDTSTGAAGDYLLQPMDGPATGRTVLFVDIAGTERKIQSVAGQASLISTRNYTPGTWTLCSLVQDTNAATLALYIDGALDQLVTMGAEPGNHGGWRIGAAKPGHRGLKGEIAEIILYDRTLTAAERQQVEAYLAARWTLSVSKNVELTGVAPGVTELAVVDSDGLDVLNAARVIVTESFVRNPSFELGRGPTGVGYTSAILGWNRVGAAGLNTLGMPFNESMLIPDRDQVAFIQGNGALSQTIYGLTAGQSYWLQFRYNLRDYQQAGPPRARLTIRLGAQTLGVITNIQPSAEVGQGGYYFTNIVFNASTNTAVLVFTNTQTSGDASLLLDAISIVQRPANDVLVQNPSFEASGTPIGSGYIQPKQVSGWTNWPGAWGVNINRRGPFANNGTAPDQDLVLFLQSPTAYLSQVLTGLTPGQPHTLIFALNARALGSATNRVRVSFANEVLLEETVVPVGGQNPYPVKYALFIPASSAGELKFENASDVGTDTTLLLDDVRVVVGDVVPKVNLAISPRPLNLLRLAWPSTATGFTLQSTTNLPGTWLPVEQPPVVEEDQWVVDVPAADAARYFRLKK